MFVVVKKYWISLGFVFLMILLTFSSTWLNEVINLPNSFNSALSILIYLPFALIILWKLLCDIKRLKQVMNKAVNILYYIFAVYYCFLSLYRIINGLEIKENLYYTIVFLGSLALYLQISDGIFKVSNAVLRANILVIICLVVVYRFIFSFLVGTVLYAYPINMNVMTGISVLTLPFLIDNLRYNEASRIYKIFNTCLIIATIISVLTSAARLMFALTVAILVVMFLTNITNKKVWTKILIAFFSAILIIAVMFISNIGNTRYALYREISGLDKIIVSIDEKFGTNFNSFEQNIDDNKSEALKQTERSDSMRSDLIKIGVSEILKNPLLGTGNVLYEYEVGEYTFQQSSHNFLIEAIVCYGILGLLIIIAFIVAVIIKSKAFSHKGNINWQSRITILIISAVFFAIGCLQPLVFNVLLCPLFLLLFAYYSNIA